MGVYLVDEAHSLKTEVSILLIIQDIVCFSQLADYFTFGMRTLSDLGCANIELVTLTVSLKVSF